MPPKTSTNGPTKGIVPPTPIKIGAFPKPAVSARSAASNAQPVGSHDQAGTESSASNVTSSPHGTCVSRCWRSRSLQRFGSCPGARRIERRAAAVGDDLVRRAFDRMRVEAEHGERWAVPDPLVDRDRRVARELDAVAHTPRVAQLLQVDGERGHPRALFGRGRADVVEEPVDRDVAVLVGQRRECLRECLHGIRDRPSRHAGVHRTVERAHGHVTAGEAAE